VDWSLCWACDSASIATLRKFWLANQEGRTWQDFTRPSSRAVRRATRNILRCVVGAALLLSSTVAWADDYNWHDRANRLQMATIFEATAKICSGMFGFTQLPTASKEEMAEKIDAYLLLQDDPDKILEDWIDVFQPALEIVSKKKGEATSEDDEEGGAALVAAAKDPSVTAQAQERYVAGAMGPFRRALDACSKGANDPFLGKNYLSGTGSASNIEKEFRDDFTKEVEGVKNASRHQKR
jgi:hypothetical protein